MKERPRLVDYSLFTKPRPIKRIISNKADNSFIINLIGIMILMIGGLCLYDRVKTKSERELNKQNIVLGFHEYVKTNI